MQVVTCGLFAALVFRIADPASVSLKEFVLPFFPVTASLYWYFTAYSGLFILTPFLNSAIRNMPKQTLRLLLPVLFAAFSVFETATDRFKLESGFSMVWLLILYCMGGILKKCDVGKHLKPWAAFLCITALTGITWAWYILNMEFSLFGITLGNESLMSYTSPTSVGAAMLYVIAFSKLRFRKHFSRFIALISPCAFSVYLLNTNELVRAHLINGRFAFLGTAAPHVIVATLLVFPIVFVAACVVIDRVRIFLFDLLHVKQLTDAIERRIRDVAIVFSR